MAFILLFIHGIFSFDVLVITLILVIHRINYFIVFQFSSTFLLMTILTVSVSGEVPCAFSQLIVVSL